MFLAKEMKKLSAFWDDYELITVCLPKQDGEKGSHRFWVAQKENLEAKSKLTIITRQEDDAFYYFKLYVEEGLCDFGKNYIVTTDCGYTMPLIVGGIVRTQRFDEQFYTDVELGAIYTEKATTFRVWAPTATEVILSVYAANGNEATMLPMTRQQRGVYEVIIHENCERLEYHFVVQVNHNWVNANDPYAKASTLNGERSVVANMRRFDQDIQGVYTLPEVRNYAGAVIYEMSVRDFTDHPAFTHPGKFLGLVERGVKDSDGNPMGLDYIASLGVTHVQLLPVYDFGSVDERGDLAEQYNWGYDPVQYNVPEGSYATQLDDPYSRILELKQMISAFHSIGIRVNMDVVYNHVYKNEEYSFAKIVPYYYYRYLPNGEYANATGCGNDVASERRMVRRFIIDSVQFWQKEYQMDGFRFDLMGILDVTTMRLLTEALRKADPNCMIYGEGWDMPTPLQGVKATMQNHEFMDNIAFFNDYFRDVMRGKNADLTNRGFLSNNIQKNQKGINAIASSLGFNGEKTIFDTPQKSINYVECHDNHTLYDRLKLSMESESEAEIKAAHRLGTALVLLSQGIAFLHSGQEAYRTKQGVENSYNVSIDINRFDWQLAADNQAYISLVKQLIQFRKKYPLFRLRTPNRIQERVSIETEESGVIRYETQKDENHFIVYINNTNEKKQILDDGLEYILSTTPATASEVEAYSLNIYKRSSQSIG